MAQAKPADFKSDPVSGVHQPDCIHIQRGAAGYASVQAKQRRNGIRSCEYLRRTCRAGWQCSGGISPGT